MIASLTSSCTRFSSKARNTPRTTTAMPMGGCALAACTFCDGIQSTTNLRNGPTFLDVATSFRYARSAAAKASWYSGER